MRALGIALFLGGLISSASLVLPGSARGQSGLEPKPIGKVVTATGSVTILSAATKNIIWAEEAGDRSLMMGGLSRGGPRKVASRIADNSAAPQPRP